MKSWKYYRGHEVNSKRKYDNTIYTFDIETSSYLILHDRIIPASDYLKLSEEDKETSVPQATMYIWQFSVNEEVYFGRTWHELKCFLDLLEENSHKNKIVFVHNLSFEFAFFSHFLKIKSVLSRKSRKVMTCQLEDYNIEFRCSLYMTNVKLSKLAEMYYLPVKKQVGDLDYTKLRTSLTPLTDVEMQYCEYDCLVVYEYIKLELKTYKYVNRIPVTSTGQVRRELQQSIKKDVYYKRIVSNSINIKPVVFNRLVESFAGGYTHANYMYSDEVIQNVDSYDETSAYPYVMVAYKFPMKEFRECHITKREQLLDKFAYILRLKMYNIRCKFYNNFISVSKCNNIKNGVYDNGRIISAEEVDITLTDVDFKLFLDCYDCKYEIIESYFSMYDYLPITFIKFILEKYKNKTEFKNVEGKELFYTKEKAKFNALYGMCVTNMIRDEVIFEDGMWQEIKLSNPEIYLKLLKEKKKSFLSFAWGVWVTAYARDNLLRRVMELDSYVIYCDTDSIKLKQGYDKTVFENYNKSVRDRIYKTAKILGLSPKLYEPEDNKKRKHLLGVFEYEGTYNKFITQGAKKYCVEVNGKINITVAGVPKDGYKCVKKIEDFRDNLIFDYKYTNKLTIMYNDNQIPVDIVDYLGVKYTVEDASGACFLPTQYELGKSLEYAKLLTDNSSKRAKFDERK